jgi:hypothetical protein
MSDVNLSVVKEHTIDSLNSRFRRLRCIIMNETVTLGTTTFVGTDFARKDVPERRKSVMQSLGDRL